MHFDLQLWRSGQGHDGRAAAGQWQGSGRAMAGLAEPHRRVGGAGQKV